MKRFIFIALIFFGIFSNCNIAKAQYAYTGNCSGKTTLLDDPAYKAAQTKIRKGKKLFFIGLGFQAVGTTMMLLVPSIDNGSEFADTLLEILPSDGTNYGYRQANLAQWFMDLGTVSAITGTILETIGGIKWISGSTKLRDLKFEYVVKGNGIVIAF